MTERKPVYLVDRINGNVVGYTHEGPNGENLMIPLVPVPDHAVNPADDNAGDTAK